MSLKEYILILGGTRGLGRNLVELWLSQGKKVICLGSSAAAGNSLFDSLKDGAPIIQLRCDLSAPIDSDVGVRGTIDHLQKMLFALPELAITGFCWNAGALKRVTFEDSLGLEVLKSTDVNYRNPLLLAHWVWMHMNAHKRPSFFSIVASTTGLSDAPKADEVLYAPLKAAQVSFARALGKSNSPASSIRVSLFCPGGMNTEFWDQSGIDETLRLQFLDPAKVAKRIQERIDMQTNPYEETVIPRGSL